MMILDPSIDLLTRAARSGLPLAFKATAIDPAQQTIQSPVRELPGSAIRSVLLDADLRADPHGLILIGLQITGELDLADCTLSYPLRFVECDFDTLLPWSHIKGTWIELYKCSLPFLSLEGAVLDALNLSYSRFSGIGGSGLDMSGAQIERGASALEIEVEGSITALGLRVGSGST